MRVLCFVVVPLLLQLAVTALFMFSHKVGGGFVGLGVMLMAIVAIPATTLFNALRLRKHLTWVQVTARTMYTTLVFPLLCVTLSLLAS